MILRLVVAVWLGVFAAPAGLAQRLDTPEQIAHERALLRVLAQPEMRAATRRIEALYAADPRAATPAGQARIKRAASSIATAAAGYALGEDATHSGVIWGTNAPHRWHGLNVPGSGFGIENPDNVYQTFALQGGGRYLLHGRMPQPGPVQLHLEVRDSIPGMGTMLVEGFVQLATIQSEQMRFAKDGSFTLAIDSDAANGRANHLAIPASGAIQVGIRQLLTDWSSQSIIPLRLERLDRQVTPTVRNIPELARRGAEVLDRIGPYWLDYNNRFIYPRPVNTMAPPRVRPGGRGISTSGHYALATDEALVITLDSLGAASLGIQIADPWGVAYDYDRATSSLNNQQARPDLAGTYTFIIAARDPGFANWLDSGGHASGIVVPRWQSLPSGADPAKAVRTVALVKLADLPGVVPPGQGRLSARERAQQRRQRARDYAVRLGR